MLALKTENHHFTSKSLPSSPPLQGEKWSIQPSSELLSLKGCLTAEKMEKKEKKMREKESSGKTPAQSLFSAKAKNQRFSLQDLV